MHVTPLADPLGKINRFTFVGKGFAHYLVFALTLAIPALVLVALILCIRTPIPRRKWAWIIFVLVGVMQWSFNWTTGEFGFQTFYVSVLGAGFAKGAPAAPFILHFCGAGTGCAPGRKQARTFSRTTTGPRKA